MWNFVLQICNNVIETYAVFDTIFMKSISESAVLEYMKARVIFFTFFVNQNSTPFFLMNYLLAFLADCFSYLNNDGVRLTSSHSMRSIPRAGATDSPYNVLNIKYGDLLFSLALA